MSPSISYSGKHRCNSHVLNLNAYRLGCPTLSYFEFGHSGNEFCSREYLSRAIHSNIKLKHDSDISSIWLIYNLESACSMHHMFQCDMIRNFFWCVCAWGLENLSGRKRQRLSKKVGSVRSAATTSFSCHFPQVSPFRLSWCSASTDGRRVGTHSHNMRKT